MGESMTVQSQVGVFIIMPNLEGLVLVGERQGGYGSGYVGFPGGRVEADETLLEAAQRELAEETGCHLDQNELEVIGVVKDRQGQQGQFFFHFVVVAVPAHYQPQLLEPDKCVSWEWQSVKKLSGKMLPGHLAGLEMWLTKQPVREITSSV
jgi:8-oxo-dGTP diphosphatase